MIRSTFFLSISIIISTGMVLAFINTQNRFEMIPVQKNIYVFDRKNQILNYCDNDGCKVVPLIVDNQINLASTSSTISQIEISTKKTKEKDEKTSKLHKHETIEKPSDKTDSSSSDENEAEKASENTQDDMD